jgi:sugar phosphate isomerase/epimerase
MRLSPFPADGIGYCAGIDGRDVMPQRNWNLGLIDSAWFGSEYEGQPGREAARKIGFDTLDLFVGFDPGAMSPEGRKAYVDGAQSVGLPVISIVCTCLGLNDFNPSVRGYHIDRANSVVELAAVFPTVTNLCFVPGEYMFQQKLLPASLEWNKVVEATRIVGEHAAAQNLELAIELLPFEFAFIKSMDTMIRFLDEVGLDNVKACTDISHLWLTRTPTLQLQRLNGRVAHVHISDCDGINHGDLPPGRGNTPFAEYLDAIRETGFAGTVSLELEFPPDPRAMRAWVEEAYGSTRRLLTEAGVYGGA